MYCNPHQRQTKDTAITTVVIITCVKNYAGHKYRERRARKKGKPQGEVSHPKRDLVIQNATQVFWNRGIIMIASDSSTLKHTT